MKHHPARKMAAQYTHEGDLATSDALIPQETRTQSSSTDLRDKKATNTSTAAGPLLDNTNLASSAVPGAVHTQSFESSTRTDYIPSRRSGTVPGEEKSITETTRRRHPCLRVVVVFCRSIRKWVSQQTWWPWEIGCWLVSLAFLLAIVGVLSSFDGKTSPHWKFGITVNTLVSVFGTVNVLLLTLIVSAGIGQSKWIWFRRQSRSLVEFDLVDQASKGPTGSLFLLFRWRGGFLAVIGACLTILILAIGPFIQQIIAFETRPVSEPTASVAVAVNYDPPNNVQETTLTVDLKAAVLQGALTTSLVEYKNTPTCATGNCTWALYQSLAVCSACAVVNGSEIERLLNINASVLAIAEEVGFVAVLPYWNPQPLNTGSDAGYTTDALPTLAFTDRGVLIADVFLVTKGTPYECILDFCVKTYNGSVRGGIFTETETKRVHQQGLTRMINSYNDAGDGSAYDYPSLDFPAADNVGQSHYVVPDAIYYLSQYINATFTGIVTSAPDNGENSESSLAFSSDVVEALYNSNAPPQTLFTNTANSLTKALRESAGQIESLSLPFSNTTAIGDTLHNETFISVRWPWIILPAVLQLFALVFLVVIICLTKYAGLEAYKDGILPALFLGIDEESRREMGRVTLLSDMNHMAEEREMVLLDQPAAGWRLSTVTKGRG